MPGNYTAARSSGGACGNGGFGSRGNGPAYMAVSPDDADCVTGSCMAGGCVLAGESAMVMVGPGRGDYVTETTYRFVGEGEGDLMVSTPRTIVWGRVFGCVALVALLAAAIVLAAMGMAKTTTTTPPMQQVAMPLLPESTTAPPQAAECTFWGDPHLRTFDGGRPSYYGEGEFYIVKSDTVVIQGRYMGTRYTAGLAATNKIAVGGPFLNGHIISVGTLEDGPITVDGMPALTRFPSTYAVKDLGTLVYSSDGNLVDKATSEWEKHVVTMHLPLGVEIEVFRWKNYVDLRIVMTKQPNQDGGCGNMNGDASDDTTEQIYHRIGARVPHGKLLFNDRAPVDLSTVEEKLLTMCEPDRLARAQAECAKDIGSLRASPRTVEMKSCMLDICYGSNEHTLRMAKSLGLVPDTLRY